MLAIVPLAIFADIRFDIAEGMPRYLTQLIYIYAVIMIVSTLVYVPPRCSLFESFRERR